MTSPSRDVFWYYGPPRTLHQNRRRRRTHPFAQGLESLERPEGMGLICRTVGEGRKDLFQNAIGAAARPLGQDRDALEKNNAPDVYRNRRC